MAHFAKLDENNIVVFVTAGRDEDDGKEAELSERTGHTYKQTSYNTDAGVHYDPNTGEPSADQSKAFRYNYAGLGYSYDEERDAFISPKKFDSWVIDETTCTWTSPVPYPEDGKNHVWNEDSQSWKLIPEVS